MRRSIKKNEHKSNSWICLLFICFAFFFMSIGYAKINSITSTISGKALAEAQDEIFITDVSYSEDNNCIVEDSEIISFNQTTLNSKIVLSDTDANSSITYSITIYNSNNISFSYVETIYDEAFYDNENIIFELKNLNVDDTIQSKGYLTFQITFKYKDGVQPSSEINELNSYLNFRFLHPVDYIESTGTQYIDTGIKSDNNTTFELCFSLSDIETNQAIYGSRIHMDDISHNIFFYKDHDSDVFRLRWDENLTRTYIEGLHYSEDKKINVKKEINQITFTTNGSSVSIESPSESWSIDGSIYIFNMNQQDTPETRIARMKLYYFKVYQSGELVGEFTPVLDRYGVACLYDSVTDSYFYNAGTGDFEYSEEHIICDYIESTGTQYIDIGIKPDNTTSTQFIFSLNELSSTTQSIFGARDEQVTNTYNMFLYKSNLRWDYYTDIQTLSYDSVLTNPTYILTDETSVTIGESVNEYNYDSEFVANYNMHIFSVNNGGNAVYMNSGMKLYYFKVFQNDVIVRNLIPVKDKNGKACLYDLISEEYFYNKGTGEFNIN